MKKHFNIFIFLILIMGCDSTDIVYLNDTWEGERIFVEGIMTVNHPLEISVTKTVNPIISGKPENLQITKAEILLVVNGDDTVRYQFDPLIRKYVNEYIIKPGNKYKIEVLYQNEKSSSIEVFIPELSMNIQEIHSILDQDQYSFSGVLNFNGIDADDFRASPGFTSNLWMKYEIPSYLTINSPCFNGESVFSLSCSREGPYEISYETRFFNYEYSPDDAFLITIRFTSTDLKNQIEKNQYKNGEFETNSVFDSAFDNAYGIFGYEYRTSFEFPF